MPEGRLGKRLPLEYVPGGQDRYRAFRRDNDAELSAGTPDELRALIRADYLRSPVPRAGDPEPAGHGPWAATGDPS